MGVTTDGAAPPREPEGPHEARAGGPPAPPRRSERAVLAIDAGNTKTDVAVVGGDGRVLGTARGGGFRPPAVGVEAAMRTLDSAVRRAVARALGASTPPAHVAACLANADLPAEERELTQAVRAAGWARTAEVANDTFALLRAGLSDTASHAAGVAVVCGAGINCAGRTAEGRTHRFPAVGALSGDWGGGGGLADAALWHAARAADGRGEPTRLADALPAHFALPSMYALIEAFHLGALAPARKHELTPVLFRTATEGDTVARSLVHRQADEIVTLAATALDHLGLLDTPVPVVLGGSVVTADHPLLHDRLREQFAQRAPHAAPRLVTAPPVLGAALLALDATDGDARAYARLRAEYGGGG